LWCRQPRRGRSPRTLVGKMFCGLFGPSVWTLPSRADHRRRGRPHDSGLARSSSFLPARRGRVETCPTARWAKAT